MNEEKIDHKRRTFLKYLTIAGITTGIVYSTPINLFLSPLQPIKKSASSFTEKYVPTLCWIGKQDCGMIARVINDRIVSVKGHPKHPRNLGKLCVKAIAEVMAYYDPYRLKAPLKRINEKGVPGKWVEISWEEALTTIAEKIKEVREIDSKLIVWQKGRSKAKSFYDKAFVETIGATKIGHGSICSDAAYRGCEYTIGYHAGLNPDFKYCNYVISVGWGLTTAGGNKLCWLTWNQELVKAKERGIKILQLDPRAEAAGPHAEWIPIKPGTDLAFFLALIHLLIKNGYIDTEYLKHFTNAPFLVKNDGYFLRKNDKEQIWDLKTNSVKSFDEKDVDPALEGSFEVNGEKVKTAFQILKETVKNYTPEWASNITGIPAEKIKRIAIELGENAKIGSKIVIDGKEFVYRPVGVMFYHCAQQELGFQLTRAILITFMLLGAINAVGGVFSEFKKHVHKNFEKLDKVTIKDPPYDFTLKDSIFFPILTVNPALIGHVLKNPEKYRVKNKPKIIIMHMVNPINAWPGFDSIINFLSSAEFVVDINPWMSETADYFADIILPTATIEKYEGPASVGTMYTKAYSLRIPPIKPLFKTKGEIEIYIEICEKAGLLYGENGYIAKINKILKLKDEYKLDINKKPTVREIFDKWAKSIGIEEGINFFEREGVYVKEIPPEDIYVTPNERTVNGIRHRLYGESLKRYQDEMKAKGIDEIYWRDYTPLPKWRTPTMEFSPKEYKFYLISYKKIEFKQSRAAFIPILNELEPEQRLIMNIKTAKELGINDGDEVWIESHNAITNEKRKIKVKVKLIEGIRPDTVALSHHYGLWTHPISKKSGLTPNLIYYTSEGYVTNTGDSIFHVKVKVYKA